MANKRIQDLPSKGTTIAANDILELSEYQSPGVYISKKILGSELGGVTSFEDLTDTFTFAGNELETVRVNAAGTALETYTPTTVSTGRFGIADSSGVYTYYTTLTLAMAAATSGQTIEFFTDYTETGAVTITLKDGVTINGNGHTYKMTYAGATNMLDAATTNGVYHLKNINLVKTNNTSGSVLITSANTISIYCSNTYFEADGASGNVITLNGNTAKLFNANVVAKGNNIGIYAGAGTSELHYCYGTTTGISSTATAIVGYGYLAHCTGISIGGCGILAREAHFCYGKGVGSLGGINIDTNGKAYKCIGISTNGRGLVANQAYIYNCIGEGTLEGILGGIEVHNCRAVSTSTYGMTNTIYNAKIYNCIIISQGSSALDLSSGAGGHQIKNCTIQSLWNNAAGHAITYWSAGGSPQTTNDVIVNNNLKVTNASAYCISYIGGGAQLVRNIKLANNTYEGSTTALTVDVNQAIVNSSDTKGNILI